MAVQTTRTKLSFATIEAVRQALLSLWPNEAHLTAREERKLARELILMHYRKPTELEKAKKITASQIVARWGGALRLTPQQVGNALSELGFVAKRS